MKGGGAKARAKNVAQEEGAKKVMQEKGAKMQCKRGVRPRPRVLVSMARGRAVDGSNDTRVGAGDPSAPQPPQGDGSTRAPAPSTHLPVRPVQRPHGRPLHGREISGGSVGGAVPPNS